MKTDQLHKILGDTARMNREVKLIKTASEMLLSGLKEFGCKRSDIEMVMTARNNAIAYVKEKYSDKDVKDGDQCRICDGRNLCVLANLIDKFGDEAFDSEEEMIAYMASHKKF